MSKTEKVLKFQTKVDEVKTKVTIENEVEYRIVLKTMDKKAAKMQGETGNWVAVGCVRIREP